MALVSPQQGLARFLRVFPKLALFFLVLHVTVMLYTILKPSGAKIKSTNETPPGVVDAKMRNVVIAVPENRSHPSGAKSLKSVHKIGNTSQNKTKPNLLDRLKPSERGAKHKNIIQQ